MKYVNLNCAIKTVIMIDSGSFCIDVMSLNGSTCYHTIQRTRMINVGDG